MHLLDVHNADLEKEIKMRRPHFNNFEKEFRVNHIGAALALGAGAAALSGLGGVVSGAIGARASDKASQRQAEAAKYSDDMQYKINQENIAATEKANAENIAFQREINDTNYERQKAENDLTRQREDTAYSRAVQDAMNAGLSPLQANALAASSMTSSQAVAPHVEAAHSDSSGYSKAADLMSQAAATKAQGLIGLGAGISDSLNSAVNNYLSYQDMQTRLNVGNAQIASMNAQTAGQEINNAFGWTRNMFEMIRLGKEIDHLDVNNSMDKMKKNIYKEFLDAEMNSMNANSSHNNALAMQIRAKEARDAQAFLMRKDYTSKYDLPIDTSFSQNFNGPYNAWGMAQNLTSGFLSAKENLTNSFNEKVDKAVNGATDLGSQIVPTLKSGFNFIKEGASRLWTKNRLDYQLAHKKISVKEYQDAVRKLGY